ncbi:Os06g0201601 [Oryza sativa Japonica Group]|uniref:Os06g0201601 protein n=1 Tax=Oryza sativa subsp. japonica TaxID=39947 RepID=A0A0P0WTQ3_ORYSJ|nr:Os06g0201601 [Oryza sativa Japonica Group]
MRLTPVARPRPAPTTSGVEDAAAGDELRHGGRGRRRAPAWGMVAWTAEDLRGDRDDAGDELRRGAWTAEDPAW